MQATTDYQPEAKNRNGEHILISLTYIGKNNVISSGVELTRALEHWRRYFEENGLNSVLVMNDNYFIQGIEGSRPAINQALVKLVSEYMQILPHIIEVEEIERCQWDGFSIKYLTSSAQDKQHTLKSLSAGADFNPYLMKRDQIVSFMKAIFEEK